MPMITLPPSKSLGARFMVASYFEGLLPADPIFDDNDDLMVLQQALLEIYSDEEPIDYGDSQIEVGASGTALRFVTAVCASSPGADYIITGTSRLMQRPMQPLLHILKEAGAGIETLGNDGNGPYRVTGTKLKGGEFSIRGDISSQFISALMLVAPYWEMGMKLNFTTSLVSAPYVEITRRLMQNFGVKVKLNEEGVEVPHSSYRIPSSFTVEADWSSAAFFYEAAALGAKDVELKNLVSPADSMQGDAVADGLFNNLGVISTFHKDHTVLENTGSFKDFIEYDFKNCPDLTLPFAVACICKGVHFRFTGISHLRLKESDRIDSLCTEAAKLGFKINQGSDSVEWTGATSDIKDETVIINTHDDHRVAMSFAMAVFRFREIRIEDPQVVEKSFIDFWNQLGNLGVKCRQSDNVMVLSL